MPGLLKVVLPVVGGIMALSKLLLLVSPAIFFETFGMASVFAEAESPLARSLIINMAVSKIVLDVLAVASYYRGSETRARIGTTLVVVLVASLCADVSIPLEFVLDKRGRKTDVAIPHDMTSMRTLGKLAMVIPLLVALAAHLAEPGLFTTNKSKKSQ
jgi:hypothetical protein